MTRTDVRIFLAITSTLLITGLAHVAGLSLPGALALGLVLAAGAAGVLAGALRTPLVELRDGVRSLREGTGEKRARPDSVSEIGALAATIDRDVAALRLALDAAEADKEQLEAVLAAMVEGVLVLDADGHIVLANPRMRELLDAWSEVLGRRPLEVVRNTEIESALREAATSDTVVVHELNDVGHERRSLLMHAARVPGTARASRKGGVVAVFHDVSEIRRLEQIRRDFMANASHELRTPLTAIRGYAETLVASTSDDPSMQTPLDAIVRNAHRLGALIDDLLELSRIEGRRSPMRPSEVDVAHLCQQLAEDAAPRIRESKLTLHVDTHPEAVAWADQRAVEQVVTNLLDNAIKYTKSGGEITLTARRAPRAIQVRVADTGVGIPPEDQSRIFERFYRVDKARSRALGGTGLGLAIVKHLVQAMGGDVYVESEPGKGTTFQFTLPALSEDAPSEAASATRG